MSSLFPAILTVHIGAGLLCVGLGVVPLVTRKGGRRHRLSGRAYAVVMAVLLVAAWIMTAIHFSAYLLALSAMATLNLFSGLRVLGRKRPDIRLEDRAKPLDWAVAATIVMVSLATLYLVLTGKTGNTSALSASLAGVGLDEVEWVASAGNHVVVHWGEREGLIRTTLKTIEARLDPQVFARSHRSTLINLARVAETQSLSDGSWKLTMTSGAEPVASRSFRDQILARLGQTEPTH